MIDPIDPHQTLSRDLVLELPTDVRTIEHAVEYVIGRCPACAEQARRLQLNFRVGLTEALSNAMLYGNSRDPSKRVLVEIAFELGRIQARVTDQGAGFDPAAVPDPTRPENLTRACGRGLFLMRKLMDEVWYNDRGNQVTLVLELESGGILEGGVQA
ncbi:MAG TPA: ATP-binding protein [Longimicrobiales bacterium]|nr:ATP-binding protein [Longimicrobiales bacterium]